MLPLQDHGVAGGQPNGDRTKPFIAAIRVAEKYRWLDAAREVPIGRIELPWIVAACSNVSVEQHCFAF